MLLTHVDQNNLPAMVDISDKKINLRIARARAAIQFPQSFNLNENDTEIQSKKGPVFATAIIAGTQAAKQTSQLIPFCHVLSLDSCHFSIKIVGPQSIEVICEVKTRAPTGVEMEAIVGASLAATTIYDMCKALSHEIKIGPIELLSKSGGKHDFTTHA